jgi:hypothetical protein
MVGKVTIALTRSGSITTSSTKYLQIDWAAQASGFAMLATGDGTNLTKISEMQSPTAGYIRTTFLVSAASISTLVLKVATDNVTGAGVDTATVRSLYVDNINRTDVLPQFGTTRQLQRTIDVAGSARSPGAIAIEHASSSLGETLAYFWPDDSTAYSPPLRQYRVSGGTVTGDGTMVSGSTEPLSGSTVTWDIPAKRLIDGGHLLMARLLCTTSATLTYTYRLRINSTDVGPTTTGTYALGTTADGAGTTMRIKAIGKLMLPPVSVPKTTGAVVRLTLTASATTTLDEAWLFNSDVGQLIWVDCDRGTAASGGPAKRLFIEPASVTTPRPTVRIGHSADRSDSFTPTLLYSWQFPQMAPPRENVFTVTCNALEASASYRAYARWHGQVAS